MPTQHSKVNISKRKTKINVAKNCDQSTPDHERESRTAQVIHAVEAAEEAVIHAIRDEVDILFHDTHHPCHGSVQHVSSSNLNQSSEGRFSRRHQTKSNDQKKIMKSSCASNTIGWGLEMMY